MKILFNSHREFLKNLGSGYVGAQHFTNMFAMYWDKTKHSYIAFVFERPKDKKLGISYKTFKRGKHQWIVVKLWIPTAEILKIHSGKESKDVRKVLDKLASIINAQKPDLFFMNGFSALAYLLFIAAHRAGIPIVATHHGLWIKETEAVQRVKKIFSKNDLEFRRKVESDLARYSKKNIFLTPLSQREYSKRLLKVPKSQVEYIALPYNPVFVSKVKAKPFTKDKKVIKIGIVARWDAVKNFPAYIVIAKEARKQGLAWEFYAVTNPVPNSWLDAHLKSFKEYIIQVNPMPPEKLKKFYQEMDLIVVPSYFETFCGVVIEALLQGRPVMVSPTVGTGDMLKQFGLNAWITQFNNPKTVIGKIKKIAKTSPPKKLINHIISHNHPDAIFKQYESLFKKVISKK